MAERTKGEAGMVLVAVLLILTFLMALAVSLTTSVVMDTTLRGGFARTTTGFYAAESGVNHGIGDYRNIFLARGVPTAADFAPRTLTIGNRTVEYQLTELAGNPQSVTIPLGQLFGGLHAIRYGYTVKSQAASGGDTEAVVGALFDVDNIPLFQFAAFYNNDLEILPGADMHVHGRVHTNGDLYLNSDAHLYIEDNQGPTVPVAQRITTVQVSAKGDIYRGRKDTTDCKGAVTVDMLADIVAPTPDLDPKDLACTGGTRRKVSPSELATWKGSLVSNIRNIAVPQPDIITKGGEFWTKADLRIVLRLQARDQLATGPVLPNTIEVQDVTGAPDPAKTALLHQFMADAAWNNNPANSSFMGTMPVFYTDVPAGAGCTCTDASTNCNNADVACYWSNPPALAFGGNNGRVYATVMGALGTFDFEYRRGGFYNWRERKWMYLLNLNLHDLLAWNMAQSSGSRLFNPADTTDGGLVLYASVQGPNSNGANNYGVRIFGSANLPFPPPAGGDPTGVTVVTDQAIYVSGDFNRGPVNAGDLPKQPAALIGDSLNVLSNNNLTTNPIYTSNGGAFSNDCQSNRSLDDASRKGANTQINAAFLSGVDVTAPGAYNGGLENYPRFHESWSGFTFTYAGSFVSLGTPLHARGPWCGTGGSSASGCNIYNPPVRNWDYDPSFNDAKNLPPLTPEVVYVQQVLFSQDLR